MASLYNPHRTKHDDWFSIFILIICVGKGCVVKAIGMGGVGKTGNIQSSSLILCSHSSRLPSTKHIHSLLTTNKTRTRPSSFQYTTSSPQISLL
jgi:hypothetical protein